MTTMTMKAITTNCTKANRLSARFYSNGYCLLLDNKALSTTEIMASDYRYKASDRLTVEVLFKHAVETFGSNFENTYRKSVIEFLDAIEKACTPKKNNKYLYEIIVQEWVPGYGWEDSCSEETTKDAREQVKCYQKNGVSARWINRRVVNPEYVAK